MPASAADLKADSGHEALFTNQTFGEDEEIIGYEGLQIAIVFTKSTLTPLLLHKYNTKQSPANDYVTLLSKEFGAGLHASADAAAGADVCFPHIHCLLDPYALGCSHDALVFVCARTRCVH